MGGAPLVLWTFSLPGDQCFDAFVGASLRVLGSNQKAATKRRGSSTALKCGAASATASGRAWAAGWNPAWGLLDWVSDSF